MLSDAERTVLRQWSRGRRTPTRLVRRARIVLRAADGWLNTAIAADLGIREKTVGLWRRRFAEQRTAGIEKDAPGRGRPAPVQRSAVEAEVIRKTTRERPTSATHWSTRTLAAELGISPASVRRIWKRHGLKPHLVRTFKVSSDPHFAEKLEDIVGLYLNPPANALVFSVDEKSQIQALDRTQPGLPIKKGRAGTMTHDYKTAWDDHPVRRAVHADRPRAQHVHAAPPAPRVDPIPQPHQQGGPHGPRRAPHLRQLRHPQSQAHS